AAQIDHRLDRERHALSEAWTAAAFAVIRDLRFFVQLPSHTVADKFSNDAEVVANCFILDRRAKVAQSLVGTSKADGQLQRALSNREQFLNSLVDHANWNRRRRVAHPAILHNTDVQLHDVAVLDPTLAPDAVHNLVVQRNANVAGENSMPQPIPQKRAPPPGALHQIRGCLIDLFGRNPRPDQLAHPIENIACRAAGDPHLVDLPSRLYRNHRTRSSIKAEISANTVSRSRFPSMRWRASSFS